MAKVKGNINDVGYCLIVLIDSPQYSLIEDDTSFFLTVYLFFPALRDSACNRSLKKFTVSYILRHNRVELKLLLFFFRALCANGNAHLVLYYVAFADSHMARRWRANPIMSNTPSWPFLHCVGS